MTRIASASLAQRFARSLAATALLLLATSTAFAAGPAEYGAPEVDDADFKAGREAVKAKDWKAVVSRMDAVVGRQPKNADAWNWLGYAWRHLGDMDKSFASYKRALSFDPVHLGAHEYIGEAYLKVGDIASAERHLTELERICAATCEEYAELKAKIAEHRGGAKAARAN